MFVGMMMSKKNTDDDNLTGAPASYIYEYRTVHFLFFAWDISDLCCDNKLLCCM